MKKCFFAVIVSLLFPILCFSQTDFHFSLAPRMSFTYGEVTELLYDDDNSQTLVSQLNWEQKPLFNIGVESEFLIKNFMISAIFDYSFPLETSYMYDFDDFTGDAIFDKCSKHPIERTINLTTELSLAYKLECSSAITIIPLLNFQYLYNKFEAGKGSILYGQRTQGKKYGNKIDYSRQSVFFFSGAGVKFFPVNKFFIAFSFLISPWGYQYAIDYHHGSGKTSGYPYSCYDYITSFFSKCKFMLSGNYIICSKLSVQLFSDFTIGFPDKGSCYTDQYSDEIYLLSRKSGAAINYIKSGFSLKLIF